MRKFLTELKSRRVYQSAAIYAVAAWGIAQVVDFVAERLFLPAWIPTVTAILFVVGFPVTVFLAWTFDISTAGIRRTPASSVRGVVSIGAAVAMLVGGTAVIYSVVWPQREAAVQGGPIATAPANSIAVLPFTSLQEDQAYISDGVAEEILYALSSVRQLHVAARTSSFSFRGEEMDIASIGRALNVRNVLEGSVRLFQNRLSVKVNLVEAETGFPLWTQSYDRVAEDVFAVQQDIARHIVDAISQQFDLSGADADPRFRAQTNDTRAYRLYLQGRHVWHQRGAENIVAAVDYLEQALEEDPQFAAGWAALASALLTAPTYQAGIENSRERAVQAALRAIELDDRLGEPYGVLAQIEMDRENYATGERYVQTALEREPDNSTLSLWYATWMINFGRAQKAQDIVEPVLARDPAYPVLKINYAFSSYLNEDYDTAFEYMQRGWEMGVRAYWIWFGLQLVHVSRGDFGAAESWLDRRPEVPFSDVDRLWQQAMRAEAERSGTYAAARELALQAVDAAIAEGYLRYKLLYLTTLGAVDRAMAIAIADASAERVVDLGLVWSPMMREFRRHPDFHTLAELLGLTAYWREADSPDTCRVQEDQPVRCFK